MELEDILFGEKFYNIWEEVQIKLPREDYYKKLADNRERSEWIIDELTYCIKNVAKIFEKSYQEVIEYLYEFLMSDVVFLSDFTAKWINGISEEEFDEDELSDFLQDTGMSEEEYLEYSAEGSYDIGIVFDALIYAFIIKNNPEALLSYLAEDMYINQKNLEKRRQILMKIFSESIRKDKN